MRKFLAPLIIGLFDDASDTAAADAAAAAAVAAAAPVPVVAPVRSQNGQFALDAAALQAQLASANARIGVLNKENEGRRVSEKAATTQMEAIQAQVTQSNQRAIRADVRSALTEAGALSPRFVELFLQDMGDKVAIDARTGDTIGLDNIAAWKAANAAFFKAPPIVLTPAEQVIADAAAAKVAADAAAAAKANATALGASPPGGPGASSATKRNLMDMSLTPAQRAAAADARLEELARTGTLA